MRPALEISWYDGWSQVDLGPSLSSATYKVRSFNLFECLGNININLILRDCHQNY